MQLSFAWDGTREVNRETELDKKRKRVLGVAAVNAGEREVGGSRSTACVHTKLSKSFCSPRQGGCKVPHTCLCMPSPSKGTGCSRSSKYSKTRGGKKVVKVSMVQQSQQNAIYHLWKQPLLAASVVDLSMAVVWEKEEEEVGTAKNLVTLVCL